MPAQNDNPDGFWESLPVVRLNDRLLALAGGRWDRLPLWLDFETLAPRSFGEWCAQSFAEASLVAWEEAFGDVEGDIVCKDPRLSLTIPLWLQTAKAKGFAPEVLMTHRAPAAIIASLTRRNGLEFAEAADLVTDYWVEMLANAPEDARVVSYEQLASDPVGTLTMLGFAIPSQEAGEDVRAFVTIRSTQMPEAPIPTSFLPTPLRTLDKLLAAKHTNTLSEDGLPRLREVMRERESHKRYAGRTNLLPLGEARPAFGTRLKRRRTVVLHCHIFKNAGTSVDVMLRDSFGARWVEKEFPSRAAYSNSDLTNGFIRSHEEYEAISTHTGDWWLDHSDEEVNVLTVIFLRHPLLRIRSAYSFERKQEKETLGTRLARGHDFPGYVRARLDRAGDYSFRNFQARRLASFHARVTTDLRSTAFRALDRAPFVGLVEEFDNSARLLEAFLKPHFESFKANVTHANPTDAAAASQEEKLGRIAGELGEEGYNELLAANAIDLAIYEAVAVRYTT